MIPLVSLFSDSSMSEETEKWCSSIESALAFFERSKPWSIAAKRSQDAVSKLYEAWKVHRAEHPPGADPTQFSTNFAGMEGTFDSNSVPDVGSLSMNSAVGQGGMNNWPDPSAVNNLSGFWDDMMWDTNLPDMLETPFGLPDYDFQGAAQDNGAPCWMQGN